MSIPASAIVQVNPGVINAGGQALALNGLILTANTAIPIGSVQPFASSTAVSAFFGASSTEGNPALPSAASTVTRCSGLRALARSVFIRASYAATFARLPLRASAPIVEPSAYAAAVCAEGGALDV